MGVTAGQDATLLMFVADHFFTAVFTIEMTVLLYSQGPYIYFSDGWRRMDFVLSMLCQDDTDESSLLANPLFSFR